MVDNVNMSAGASKKLSVEDFRNKLQKWFSERGHLADFQSLLRQKMILALQETSLCSQSENQSWCFLSMKNYAVTFLVAEFLFKKGYHYTLSVFTSEVHKIKCLPEFSPKLGFLVGKFWPWDRNWDCSPQFKQEDVAHIMEALGFLPDSKETASVFDVYEGSKCEPLLLCVIQAVIQLALTAAVASKKSAVNEIANKSVVHVSPASLRRNMIVKSGMEATDLGTDDISLHANKRPKKPSVRKLIQKLKRYYEHEVSEVRAKLEKRHEQAVAELIAEHQRDLESAQLQHRSAQEAKEAACRRELLEREALIQAEIARHQAETRERLDAAEQERREGAEREVARLQEETMQLQHQKNEVDLRLRFLEDYMTELRQFEKNFQEESEKELSHIAEQKRQLDLKQQQIDEGFTRLDRERRAMESVQLEIEESYKCLLQASASMGHTHGLKQELAHLRKELDAIRHKLSGRSHTPTLKLSPPRRADAHPRSVLVAQDKSQQTDPPPQAGQMASTDVVKQLRDENCELRAYAQQLRYRIDELMLQALHLTKQLESARDAVRVLSKRSAHTVPSSCDRSPQRSTRGVKAPHSSSSDDGSPTDDVLREAKKRLRELEEESEAVDKSYQRFRLRQSRSLPQAPHHDLLQRFRRGQHVTPHFQQWDAIPHSAKPVSVSAVLGRTHTASRGRGLTPGVPRREYSRQKQEVTTNNYFHQPQLAERTIPTINTDTSRMGRPGLKYHARENNFVATPSQSNNNKSTLAAKHQWLYSKSLEELSVTENRFRRQPIMSLGIQKTQPSIDKSNSTMLSKLTTATQAPTESFQEAPAVVQDQEPLICDVLENGTEGNVMKDPSPSSVLGNGMQLNAVEECVVYNGVLGNRTQCEVQEPLLYSSRLVDERQGNMIQNFSLYNEVSQNESQSNVIQEPTSYDEVLANQSENEGQSKFQLHHNEPNMLQTFSDGGIVIKNGILGTVVPVEGDARTQQENGVAYRLLQSEEQVHKPGANNEGGTLEPQIGNELGQMLSSTEAVHEEVLQGRQEEPASDTQAPSSAASVHSQMCVELVGDKEAIFTEGSLSSVGVSSDQAISAGHYSKSDPDDEFWN